LGCLLSGSAACFIIKIVLRPGLILLAQIPSDELHPIVLEQVSNGLIADDV
jgi:hypothetical protein